VTMERAPHEEGAGVSEEPAENVCIDCGCRVIQVPAPGSGWVHASAADGLACKVASEQAATDEP
jgi:hypothetical protein